MLEDQRGYYLIGYRPEGSTFDEKSGRRKFHHLSLKVTRPGKYNVRMRNGFFGIIDEETKPAERTAAQRLLAAISPPFGSSDVHLQLTSLFANDAANGSFMRSLLHIDMRDLTFKDGPNGTHECVFDVLAMTFGDNGVQVDYTGQTFTIQLPDAEYQRAMQHGLVYNVTVPVKKHGAYQFRMALRDTATKRTAPSTNLSKYLTWEANVWHFRAWCSAEKRSRPVGRTQTLSRPIGKRCQSILKPVRRCAILGR